MAKALASVVQCITYYFPEAWQQCIYIYLVENLNRPLDPISLVSIQCTTRFVVIPTITIPEILLTQQQSDSYFWREIWNQPTVQCTYQNTLASVIHVIHVILKYCIQYVLGLFTSAATIILIGYCNNKTQMLLDFGQLYFCITRCKEAGSGRGNDVIHEY